MKTHRFEIAKFLPSEPDDSGNIYIDWPSIHRQASIDHIQWITNQDPIECQMMLERRINDSHIHVMVEIYSEKLATLYGLMWAK
jgi:hypothetical protein